MDPLIDTGVVLLDSIDTNVGKVNGMEGGSNYSTKEACIAPAFNPSHTSIESIRYRKSNLQMNACPPPLIGTVAASHFSRQVPPMTKVPLI